MQSVMKQMKKGGLAKMMRGLGGMRGLAGMPGCRSAELSLRRELRRPCRRIVVPAALPGREHRVRILRPATAAVVAAERHEQVALLDVEVVAQDHSSRSAGWSACGTGGVVRRRRSAGSRTASPACSRARRRPRSRTCETAFDLDQAEHQRRIEPRARRLVSRVSRNSTRAPCRHAVLQAFRHLAEPARYAMRSSMSRNRLRRPAVGDRPASATRTASASGSSFCAPARASFGSSARDPAPSRTTPPRSMRAACVMAPKPAPHEGEHLGQRHACRRRIAPALVLDLAFLQAALADRRRGAARRSAPSRRTSRPALAAVVEDDVDAGSLAARSCSCVGAPAHGSASGRSRSGRSPPRTARSRRAR